MLSRRRKSMIDRGCRVIPRHPYPLPLFQLRDQLLMYPPSARLLVRLACYLLILFATIAAVIIVFISQLDLNSYKSALETQLSSALDQPVIIGHCSLSFSHGLALTLNDVKIGRDYETSVDVSHAELTLKLSPLLNGQFVFRRIQLDDPEFRLLLPQPESEIKETEQSLVDSLGIRELEIKDGRIIIFQKLSGKIRQKLALTNISAALHGWRPQQKGNLVITGQFQKQKANFLIETTLPASRKRKDWRDEEHNTRIQITHFSTENFSSLRELSIPAILDLDLTFRGIPSSGADFEAIFSSNGTNSRVASLAGHWISTSSGESLTKITGELFKIPISGSLSLERKPKKYTLTGNFGTTNAQLTPEILRACRLPFYKGFNTGRLKKLSVALHKSWDPTRKISGLPQFKGEISIDDLDWNLPEERQLQAFSASLTLRNKTLQVSRGQFIFGHQPVNFTGKVVHIFSQPIVDTTFKFNVNIGDLLPQETLPETWKIDGRVPGFLKLIGSLKNVHFQLVTNLNSTTVSLGRLFHKKPTDQASFQAKGTLFERHFEFDDLTFTLNDVRIAANGFIQSDQTRQKYGLEVEPVKLQQLKPYSPLLQHLQVSGEISADLTKQQSGYRGILILKNAGAHLTSLIGNLNGVSGSVDLTPDGLSFKDMEASLGKSRFIVSGALKNWRDPQFGLDLKGKKVRARDLIFSSQHLTLYDVEGHLGFNADGISFAPVRVRLEDETLAVVTGSVTNFSQPTVSLDIQSEKVNVLDIINLFTGPSKTHPQAGDKHGVPILITVSAKQGTLGGLHFQNARTIIRGDSERLTLFPLTFNERDGRCHTRVVFDYGQETRPLKISGHLENVEASTLYENIFLKRGMIIGNMSGDFYIEGDPKHPHFWQNAQGGVHVKIKDGVLRQFKGLAKVFSILNVSQIFAGKLPDINREGMPFSLVEGSIRLGKGRVESNDIKITSVAMNLSLIEQHDLVKDSLDATLAIMPLRTVDKIITSIPIAGWILGGDNKALVTAYFKITGSSLSPDVKAVPINSVSRNVSGIFKRTLGLPLKAIQDLDKMLQKKPPKKMGP